MIKSYKLFPSYVGSKSYWVGNPILDFISGSSIIEPFGGSAAISMSYGGGRCHINDTCPILHKIYSRYDELEVWDNFTYDEYYKLRSHTDWWKYSFMFQSMSFSGVFRYSKNGYNVPAKASFKTKTTSVRDLYDSTLRRKLEIDYSYSNVNFIELETMLSDYDVCILDPPYENSKASYNSKAFNYDEYWQWVNDNRAKCQFILFDSIQNLTEFDDIRKMRVNGKHKGNHEVIKVL